ncbi:MAG: hypothetical protein SPK18_00860 [Treponema sp.]|nr:hypothetical protein [Treponema sp.]MDY5757116.1 hypothetical protein [Treponema sp.]
MTYQELINEIRDLGFSDDSEIEEFAEAGLLYSAINRAITRINLELYPIIEKYEFDISDDDTGYLYITMTDIDDLFLDFADMPILFERDGANFYTKFGDYEIESDNTLVINADKNKGSFRVFYKVAHDTFTGKTSQLKEDLPLQLKVHHLVPLLASYYVWNEDEPTKAAQYLNLFESEKAELKEQALARKFKVRVMSGGL